MDCNDAVYIEKMYCSAENYLFITAKEHYELNINDIYHSEFIVLTFKNLQNILPDFYKHFIKDNELFIPPYSQTQHVYSEYSEELLNYSFINYLNQQFLLDKLTNKPHNLVIISYE